MSKEFSNKDLFVQYRPLKEFIDENKKPGRLITLTLDDDKKNVIAIVKDIRTMTVLKKSEGVPFPSCECGGEGILQKVPSIHHTGTDTQIRCSICGRGTHPSDVSMAIRMWIAIMLGVALLWESEHRGSFSFRGGFD